MAIRVSLESVFAGPPADAPARVEAAARAAGAFVVDARWFSDLLLSVHLELDANNVLVLCGQLEDRQVRPSEAAVERARGLVHDACDACCVLSVHCTQGAGDKRRTVPAVPG